MTFIKRILSITLSIGLLANFYSFNAKGAVDSVLYFSPSTDSVEVGEDFSMDIMVNPGTNAVTGAEVYFTFDETRLQVNSITLNSSVFSFFLDSDFDNDNGTGSVAGGTSGGTTVTSSTRVATVSFRALATGTNSPIEITDSSLVTAEGEGSSVLDTSSLEAALVTITGSYTIGGTISGLNGTVVIRNNEGNNLSASSNGNFTFSNAVADGGSYAVTVLSQPFGQNCTVSNHSGTVSGANVTNVGVVCENVGPWRSGGSPGEELKGGTKDVNISINTDVNATCRFSTTSGIAFDSMTNTFSGEGTTSHTYSLTGLSGGASYSYFVRCRDGSLESNTDDYTIAFSIDNESKKKNDPKKEKRELKISKKNVKRGQVIVQSGKRFSKNSNVALYFGKNGGGYYKPVVVKTNSEGKFSVSYKIPNNKPFGKYKWYSVDLKTGKKSKSSSYTVK